MSTVDVSETILDRIKSIKDEYNKYSWEGNLDKDLEINYSEDRIDYILHTPKIFFSENDGFQMKLKEKAFSMLNDFLITKISEYSYHGFHIENPKNYFIRFDFEPFKENYAPVHINAPKHIWGDHLTYPDSTNLDISKMNCKIALTVFSRFSADKNDYPTNPLTNKPYVEIFAKGE
ncbi:hypothetical protein JTI58_10890 [Lysinibacillus fusiformis]|uniref:hypothetical protein n=1 Tax=Lysinibacillus fusiformis TaxID=28031 RepID=UPI0019688A9C|nr:hypothetical protein [Lysinibacillus fusiformis]QSB12071.1 hypothetical protein JTI58_10890 [Lysinibacillus fusiformis]